MRSPRRGFAAGIAAAAIVLSLGGAASAQQPTAAGRETARTLMDEGDRKRDAGDWRGALQDYEGADAIMHVPTTGLEVARAQVALGLLVEARETLAKVLRLPVAKREPEAFVKARQSADALNGDLANRIPTIQLAVVGGDPAQTPQVTLDGDTIPPAAIDAPRKLNPGTHVVVVRSGSVEKRVEFSVAERDNKTVSVDLAKGKRVREKEKDKVDKPVEEEKSDGSTAKIMIYGGFGLGVVGVAAGAVTGLMSISKTNELKGVCPNNACPVGKQADIDSATGLGNISTVAFILGGVGVGVGVVGLVLSGGDKKEGAPAEPATARVRPLVGPGSVGLAGTF